MCGRNCCGAFWNILLVVVLVATVACPWYWTVSTAEVDTKNFLTGNWTAQGTCSVVKLTSWRTEFCAMSGSCVNLTTLKDFACPHGDSYSWRDVDGVRTSNRGKSFDIGVGCAVMSLLCAFISCVGFFIRCCCKDTAGKSYLLIVVSFLGMSLLVGASISFAVSLPKAYTADAACYMPSDKGTGPCSTLYGSADNTIDLTLIKGTIHDYWGPVGWAVGVVAIPIYLLVMCLACTRTGGYTSINDNGSGNYYRHGAAPNNYV